jgi:hypothetical protein
MADSVSAKLGEAHVEVVAKTDRLNRDLQATRVQTQQTTDRMKKGFDDVEEKVTFATRALFGLRGTIGTIIAIPLIQALVDSLKNAAENIERVAYEAKTIGLSAAEFQKLQYAAMKSDVEMAALNTALGFFAKGLGQAQAGIGPLVETLKKIDPELAKQIRTAKSMQEALEIAADAISSLATAEDRAAVTTSLFGRSGITMGRLMEGGAEGIRKLADQAERLGFVMDDADIEKAAELADAFENASKAIGQGFKEALIAVAPTLVATLDLVAKLAHAMRAIPEAVRGFHLASLKEQATQLEGQIANVSGSLDEMQQKAQAGGIGGWFAGNGIEHASQQLIILQGLLETTRKRIAETNQPFTTEIVGETKPQGRRLKPTISDEDLKKLADERKQAQEQLRDFHIRYLQDTEKLVEAVNAEHEKELANFQDMLNRKLITEDQFQKARAELGEITAKKLAEIYEKELKGVIDAIQTVGKGVEDAFGQWVETGKFNAQEMVRSILAELAKLTFAQGVIQPLFGGGDTKGGGLLGSLIGPLVSGFKFHGGGTVGAGGLPFQAPASVWANAPRLHNGFMPDEYPAILKRNESVLTPQQMEGMGGMTINVDARGAEIGVETRVVAAIRAMRPELDRNAVTAVGKTRATRPGYLR